MANSGDIGKRAWARPRVLAPALLVLLVPLTLSAEITRGPYLQNVKEHSVIVAFEGSGFLAPVLRYGEESSGEFTQACQCQGVHCHCLLEDLAPDTTYLYLVADGEENLSAEYTLASAPDYSKTFSFAVHGDNRSDHSSHEYVVSNLAGEDLSFVVNTGDMVSSGEVEADWDMFFQIELPIIATAPIYPSVGNHDEDEGNTDIFDRVFHVPIAESGSPATTYYSFDYANSHFVVIDDFVQVHPWWECLLLGKLYDNCINQEQLAWLEVDLNKAANNAAIDHVFVFAHEGPYSSKQGRTGSAAMRDLLPIFAKSKVKVILSGHDHYFEHGISGNGIHYVISGGGGAPLYETNPDFMNQLSPHKIIISKSIHNYQVVTVEGPLVKVVTRDVDAQSIIDVFEVGEKPDCTEVADCEGEEEGTCEGQWECIDYGCVWVCDPPPSCETVADCGPDPETGCPGHWQCAIFGQCQWICDPVEPECYADVDCVNPPLTDCEGGAWRCTDDVCEWLCPGPVRPPDDVTEQPTEEVTEQSPEEVTGRPEDLFPSNDAMAHDGAQPDSSSGPPPAKKGGGCNAASASPGCLLPLLMLLGLLMIRRKRCLI